MLYCVRRSEMSPMVCFQRYAASIVSPSTQQPPGNRTNADFRPPIIVDKSGRNPFAPPFHVSFGTHDTMPSQNVPVFCVLKTSRALGSVSLAVIEKLCSFQSGVRPVTCCFP